MRNHCEAQPGRHTECYVRYGIDQRLARVCSRVRVASVVLVFVGISAPCLAAPISRSEFDGLVARCAPHVSPEVLRAVAAKESHFEPLALHNNTLKITRVAADVKAGKALAERWIAAGNSVDIGLMQINSPNLVPLGLSLEQSLEPCGSLAAASTVLQEAYSRGASQAEQQAALLIMLSRYNTGRSLNGLVNGYVAEVVAAAAKNEVPKVTAAVEHQPVVLKVESWDVWENAADARLHGANWIVDLQPSAPTASTQKHRITRENPR